MNHDVPLDSKPLVRTPWYKVPILWFMISVLAFTVISGLTMLTFATRTQDAVIVEEGLQPLNKKQGMPQAQSDHSDAKQKSSSESSPQR